MTARKTWPRSQEQHESAAAEVLRRYGRQAGWKPSLPVPVADIVERLFDLTVICQPIAEPIGEMILGALSPRDRRICLNETHLDLFERYIGPEAFTLAHELGHWVYDAVDSAQGMLFPLDERVFCRSGGPNRAETADIREINANKFASCLLLPADLLSAAVSAPFASWSALGKAAATWGVSKTTLRIRLETLALGAPLP